MTDTSFIPSSEDDRKRVKEAVAEGSGFLQRIDDYKSQITDIVNMLHDNFGIPKKQGRLMIKTHYKQNYLDVSTESTVFEVLYETIFPNEIDDND